MISRSALKNAGWEEQDNFLDKESDQRLAHKPDFIKTQMDGVFNMYLRDPYIVIERYKVPPYEDIWAMSSWTHLYTGKCGSIFDLRALENLLEIK